MMMIERDRSRDTPWLCLGLRARLSDRDPARGLHQGQRASVPRKQAGNMTATCDGRHQLNSTLANQGPSKHDKARRGLRAASLSLWRLIRIRLTPLVWQFLRGKWLSNRVF